MAQNYYATLGVEPNATPEQTYSMKSILVPPAATNQPPDSSYRQQRQQLKWLAFVAVIIMAGAGLAGVYSLTGLSYLVVLAGGLSLAGIAVGVPLAVGMALLRRRLYEIGVIVNRALVYTALTFILLLIYSGSLFLLQSLFRRLTSHESDLAVVISTLVIVALFNPLRRRVQAAVDRRFYPHKYEAAQTLAAFSARLQQEVDLDRLADELLTVVEQTMQPTHVSLWLRKPK